MNDDAEGINKRTNERAPMKDICNDNDNVSSCTTTTITSNKTLITSLFVCRRVSLRLFLFFFFTFDSYKINL